MNWMWRAALIAGPGIIGFSGWLAHRGGIAWADFAVLFVAVLTGSVAVRQLEIMKQQGDIVLEQLAALPELRPRYEPDPSVTITDGAQFLVNIENIGTRTALGFSWHIGVQAWPGVPQPTGFEYDVFSNMVMRPPAFTQIMNPPVWLWRGRAEARLFKKRRVTVLRVRLNGLVVGQKIRFVAQLAWDEGEFPAAGAGDYHVDELEITSLG